MHGSRLSRLRAPRRRLREPRLRVCSRTAFWKRARLDCDCAAVAGISHAKQQPDQARFVDGLIDILGKVNSGRELAGCTGSLRDREPKATATPRPSRSTSVAVAADECWLYSPTPDWCSRAAGSPLTHVVEPCDTGAREIQGLLFRYPPAHLHSEERCTVFPGQPSRRSCDGCDASLRSPTNRFR